MTAGPAEVRLQQESPALLRLDPAQARPAAGVLARAFFPDPLIVHYLPDPAWRARMLPAYMLACLRYALLYGEVWTAPGLDGVACWLPSDGSGMHPWRILRSGYWTIPFSLGWRAYRRMSLSEPVIDRIHQEILPRPHWYLMLLGVEPSRQGQGIGGRLIAPRLAEIAAQGLPCYLETLTEIDVAFYRKHGFEAAREVELAPGLRLWAMVRRPK